MVSIKDVADMAGVSTATVSRVLSDKPHVRPQIRERVLAAVSQLNYRPNRVARSLRVQQSNTIGLIVSDIRNPFFTMVSRAIEDVAYENRLNVFLCNADEDPDKEAMYLELMQAENVAGVILSPTRQFADSSTSVSDLEVPVVVIDRRMSHVEVDSVLLDNVESAYRLVAHLLSDGRRRIGAMFGIGSTTGRERHAGYTRALAEQGLEAAPELVNYVNAKEAEGYSTAKKLLDLPERPDAIFTSNALLSAGAFRAIRESGLAVPAEIGFASFDETTWTPLVEPGITVIVQPTYEIGQTAIELLLKRIETPDRPAREVILRGKLLVRHSCGVHP